MLTEAQFRASAEGGQSMPAGLSAELQALWLCRAGRWDEAHTVAQDIHTPAGSWIHALLHLIEGDESNARYWFRRAGRPPVGMDETDAEWGQIAAGILGNGEGSSVLPAPGPGARLGGDPGVTAPSSDSGG